MSVYFRPEVLSLPRYKPGKTPLGAGAIKLSSNENPYLPKEAVLEAGRLALQKINHYPDLFCTSLREQLARYHGVKAEQIVCGNGLSALLVHALTAVAGPGAEVLFAWRSFESYPIATVTAGAKPVTVPLKEGVHDLQAMAAAITARTRAIIICNPNNPTGKGVSHADLVAFLRAVDPRVLVIVDEAYIDFSAGPVSTVVGELEDFPNVVVARTFSKAFALAGARVGYLVGHSEVISAISAVATPFGVSAPSQALALASLQNREAVAEAVAKLVAERERVLAELAKVGLVISSQANFYWLGAEVFNASVPEVAHFY